MAGRSAAGSELTHGSELPHPPARRVGIGALWPVAALLVGTCLLAAPPAYGRTIGAHAGHDPTASMAGDFLLHGKLRDVLLLYKVDPRDGGAKAPADGLARAPKNDADRAILGAALTRLGRYKDAGTQLAPCQTRSVDCALAAVALARASATTRERVTIAEKALKAHPDDPRLLVAFGEGLYELGRDATARDLLDPLADAYQQGRHQDVPARVAVARSLALNGFHEDANVVLADAADAATNDAERKLVERTWGLLFVSKYNYRDADVSLRKVLKIDPADEAAVLAMAEIDLRSDHNVRKAKARLDAFLSDINPRSAAALALRAEVALQDEDPEDAMARIKAAEKARADHPEVLAVKAAACKLEDDKRCFKAALRTSTRRDPTDGRPLLRAAHYLEMAHRYPEVLDMLQLAIKRDPELWQAHAQLGMAKARLVQDEGALDHLLIAFRNDPYNVRTANQLNVLHDGVLKQMVTLDGPVVDLRVHRRHRKAFERTMLPFLQDSFDTLAKRYGGPAKQPLRVEVFPTTEQFSVRTVGLPRLGAHAVCFGHLITSRSPAEKPFNWKMVLHHELAHVWHIQQSGGRVPRWLTEGLAMMESTWADPRWEMVVDRRMYDRLRQRRLSSIRHFNLAFSQARSMSDIGNAYQQAAWLVRYLDEAYGFDKLRRLVAGHRKPGSRTPALIKQIYGKTAEAIDAEFAAWLGKQLVRYDKDFRPDVDLLADGWASRHGKAKAGGSKGADAKPAKPAKPADPPGTPPGPTFKKASELDAFGKAIDAAIGHLKERDAVKAVEALDVVLEPYLPGKGPDGKPTAAAKKADQAACAALYLAMQSAKRARKGHPATDYAQALVDSQGGVCDGLHAHLFLAMDAAERAKREQSADAAGQLAAAKPHFERAHGLDPRDQETLRRWLELADAAEDRPEIRRLSRLLLAIAPHAVPPAQALGLAAWDDWAGEQLKLASEGKRPDATKVDPRQGARGLAAATAQDVRSPLARALVRDMGDAARWLEEVTPHAWGAALFEARAHVVAGRLKPAFVPYRLAAERGQDARQRAIAWCELAVVATAAGSKADAAEASRRCQADAT